MASGGSRVRSGPKADPNSARSEKRELVLTALPSEGRKGNAPAFPLPQISRFGADGVNAAATKKFRSREIEIWRQIWKTPQACWWEANEWMWDSVAEFCRIKTAVELDPDSNAALLSRLREYRNSIALSPDGLKSNGLAIAANEVAAKATQRQATKKAAAAPKRERRLRSVGAK